jgi:prepilin-type N-terminal cleavage/methylation domain-containing protein/prepilin-type processing-associated H-X9-DG protein
MNIHIPKRRAFTLLELLVVIAIIAILASLFLGNVARAKLAAHRVTCMSHLKQWVTAAVIYTQDNDDRLPREAGVDGINSWETTAASTNRDVWYNALAETAGISPMTHYAETPSTQHDFYASGKIFHCPRARFSDAAATYPNFSLAMNSKLMRDFESAPIGDPFVSVRLGPVCRLGAIKDPARTVLFADNGVRDEPKFCAAQQDYTGQPKTSAAQFPGRHNESGNIAFADGHVQAVRGKDVVQMEPGPHQGKAIHPPREVVWCPDPNMVP